MPCVSPPSCCRLLPFPFLLPPSPPGGASSPVTLGTTYLSWPPFGATFGKKFGTKIRIIIRGNFVLLFFWSTYRAGSILSRPSWKLWITKGSSISWVAKFKGDKNSECKLSNGWLRSYKVMKLLLSPGKGVVEKLQGDKLVSQSSMELYYPWISGPLRVSWLTLGRGKHTMKHKSFLGSSQIGPPLPRTPSDPWVFEC